MRQTNRVFRANSIRAVRWRLIRAGSKQPQVVFGVQTALGTPIWQATISSFKQAIAVAAGLSRTDLRRVTTTILRGVGSSQRTAFNVSVAMPSVATAAAAVVSLTESALNAAMATNRLPKAW